MKLELNNFESISLSQMGEIRLMKRVDQKYVIPFCLLPQLLSQLTNDYDIQEIDGKRSFKYATLYYDTPDYEMFRMHLNGKLNRIKIRNREYVDSNLSFLEIKKKSNKGETIKIRISGGEADNIGESSYSYFLSANSPYCSESLEAKIWSLYHRITLVNKAKTERLTIDTNLSFVHKDTRQKISLPGLSIVEIKKDRWMYRSPVTESLNRLRIKPAGMSKYCLGVALTENPPKIKNNVFKLKLHNISKITPFIHD